MKRAVPSAVRVVGRRVYVDFMVADGPPLVRPRGGGDSDGIAAGPIARHSAPECRSCPLLRVPVRRR
jgi:hypothetical protein